MAKTIMILLATAIAILGMSARACETIAQKHQAASELYKDKEFREFTCGDDSCDEETMESYLEFNVYKISSNPKNICIATTNASVKNRYQGIFTFDKNAVQLQLIIFANDIRIKSNKNHSAVLDAFQLTDDASGRGIITTYEWNGMHFNQINQADDQPFNGK